MKTKPPKSVWVVLDSEGYPSDVGATKREAREQFESRWLVVPHPCSLHRYVLAKPQGKKK